jgi:subtilisin family serine protease
VAADSPGAVRRHRCAPAARDSIHRCGGNSNLDNDTSDFYPANYYLPNIIAVAATTSTDARASFSNFGRRTVHLGAPGDQILSTTPNNGYNTLSGTSMATPHVTGVAALLKAQDGTRDWRAIRNLILAVGITSLQ